MKRGYRQPPLMTKVKKLLKETTWLTRHYYKNGWRIKHFENVWKKAGDCTKEILKAKNDYILKMAHKFIDPRTSQIKCWTI